MHHHRSHLSPVAAVLTLSMVLGVTSTAAAATDADLAPISDEVPTISSQAAKQELVTSLATIDLARPGAMRVDAVAASTETGYLDAVRLDPATGKKTYLHDLHLVSFLSSGSDTDVSVNATADLLRAGRLTARTAVDDAAVALSIPTATATATASSAEEDRLRDDLAAGQDPLAAIAVAIEPKAVDAATRDLDKATHALARSDDALHKGLAVAASSHQAIAWRHATNALANLGLDYSGDTDGDGLDDLLEARLGANPLRGDTDGDGLSDLFEFDRALAYHLPSDPDTDGDGISDAAEDIDGDGLSALREQSLGTDPMEPDSDHDGASDADELAADTDPLVADTDADGLLDGAEPPLGVDPTLPDTDGDGVGDADEQLERSVAGPGGLVVDLVGTGDVASSFTAHIVTGDPRASASDIGQVGPAYELRLDPLERDRLAQATLHLPFDPASVRDPADLRVFWLDEEQQAWVPVDGGQSVDPAAGTVSTTVQHFSTYAIFDIVSWDQTWTASTNPCARRTDGGGDVVLLDLSLVLDSSGSMRWNDPQGLRKTSAKSFVDALLPDDRAAVVDFDSRARVLQGLTTDKDAVKSAIDRVDSSGGTNIAAGVSTALDVLDAAVDDTRARIVILLTDGQGFYDPQLTLDAKVGGITIYTIGLGSSVDVSLLQSIASETGGQYYGVSSADELPEVFRRISDDTGGDPRADIDTDNDGLNDCVEIEGARSGTSTTRYQSDPTDPDTDGDGVPDGDEVVDAGPVNGIPAGAGLYTILSDPADPDTDGDGLGDAREFDQGTDPWRADTDGDGLDDATEIELSTDPTDTNTDDDPYDDRYEVDFRTEGFDPLFHDEQVSKWRWATEFAKGYLAGDAWQSDTLAWIAGNLASGATSFIPVIGWIVGAVLDIRDTVANAIRGDWAGTGLSAVGIVPIAGDAVSIVGKAAKFIGRNLDKADEVLAMVSRIDQVPTREVARLARQTASHWDDLRGLGFGDEALRTLLRSRGGLGQIADGMRRAGHVAGPAADIFASGRSGEVFLEGVYGAATRGVDLQVYRRTRELGIGTGRYVDVLVDGIAHESKVGYVRYSRRILRQIDKDAALQSAGRIDGAQWHFLASSRSGSMGADARILDYLDANGIPYTFHPVP